jgi:hypothetical protein
MEPKQEKQVNNRGAAVNGRQYVAIASGPSPPAKRRGLANVLELKGQRHATVLYVFGL